jgi:hypothetical protein
MQRENQPIPQGMIYLLAYLAVLCLGTFGGGLVLLITTLPALISTGHFYSSAAIIIAMTGAMPLVLVSIALYVVWLWWQQPQGSQP